MKKFILMAASVSTLCAGSLIKPLVDYDKQDAIQAETQVEQKLILPVTEQPVVTAPGVRKKTFNYELDLLAGRNFADDDAVVKDATTMGIRLNRYITDTVAIQLGYDRIFDADYKLKKKTRLLKSAKTARTGTNYPSCPTKETNGNIEDTDTNNGNGNTNDNGSTDNGIESDTYNNGGNGDNDAATDDTGNTENTIDNDGGNGNNGNAGQDGDNTGSNGENGNNPGNSGGTGDAGGNDSGTGGNGNTGEGGNGSNAENPLTVAGTQNLTKSTDIDRFYLNVQKEIRPKDTNLIPYFFAGVGYEHVNDKNLGLESQGFFNTGGGLKYSLNEKFRLVSEAKVIKKFKDHDLDVVAMLGVGLLFGERGEEAPEKGVEQLASADEPKPESQDLTTIIIDDEPQPKSEVSAPTVPAVTQPIERVRLDLNELHHAGDYYVQVAAVSSNHSTKRLIHKLEQQNLRVVVKTATVRGRKIKRILVGPYMQRSEAKADLPKVRKISKGAFIKKLP